MTAQVTACFAPDPIRVTLLPWQLARAEEVGTQRHEEAEAIPGRKLTMVGDFRYTRLRAHVLGAQAELAVALWSGRPWNTLGMRHRKEGDVGRWEVRHTLHRFGGLAVVRRDLAKRARAFILVRAHYAPTFYLAGWARGWEVFEHGEDRGNFHLLAATHHLFKPMSELPFPPPGVT